MNVSNGSKRGDDGMENEEGHYWKEGDTCTAASMICYPLAWLGAK